MLRIVNSDPAVPSILGNTYKEQGDYENARKWFLRALHTAESIDPKSNLAARTMASESHANLGELEWEEGNRSRALEHLTKATTYWIASASPREVECKRLILSSVTLSLMLKYGMLGHEDKAVEFARQRLKYVPNCSKAKAIIEAATDAENSGTTVSVLLRFQRDRTQGLFQMAVLRFAQVTIKSLTERYGEAISGFKVDLAKDRPAAMFSCVTSNCDPEEVRDAIVLSWKTSTNGNGVVGIPST